MSNPAPASALQQFSDALADVVAQAAPSVVAVHSARSRSSGFVWRPGLIVTADEALAEEGDISVMLPGGETAAATVAGRDPTTDVAVLRVDRARGAGRLASIGDAGRRRAGAGGRASSRRAARRLRRGVVRRRGVAQPARRRHRRPHRTRSLAAPRRRGRPCARRLGPRLRHGGVRAATKDAGDPRRDHRARRGGAGEQGTDRPRLSRARIAARQTRRRRRNRRDGDECRPERSRRRRRRCGRAT